jgi:hypothetical protein
MYGTVQFIEKTAKDKSLDDQNSAIYRYSKKKGCDIPELQYLYRVHIFTKINQ